MTLLMRGAAAIVIAGLFVVVGCGPQPGASDPSSAGAGGAAAGAPATPECKMGSNGQQTCGYNCKLGSGGGWFCASTPEGKCALNANGTWTCP